MYFCIEREYSANFMRITYSHRIGQLHNTGKGTMKRAEGIFLDKSNNRTEKIAPCAGFVTKTYFLLFRIFGIKCTFWVAWSNILALLGEGGGIWFSFNLFPIYLHAIIN